MMRSIMFITALYLCSLSLVSTSGSEFQTVEVQPGEDVTLPCSKFSSQEKHTFWFTVVNKNKPSCVSSMFGSLYQASFGDGFQNGKFEMSSNITFIFLKIKQVDLPDAGLYFCGFYINKLIVIPSAVELRIQGAESSDVGDCQTKNVMCILLGFLTGLLTIAVIILVLKIRKLDKAVHEEPHPDINKNMSSDDVTYTALSFQTKAKRSHRPVTQRELEAHVVYTATR